MKKDNKNQPIVASSIVRICDKDCGWRSFQGFVVDPDSRIEGEEYCVAVFFGREVSSSNFNRFFLDIEDWDSKYEKQLRTGSLDFLLENKLWENCPRVVFFKPSDLLVEERWSVESLVKRFFLNTWYSRHELPKDVSPNPSDHICFLADCHSVATKTAVYNVWGIIYPLHVCDDCFSKTNGCCADDLPKLKENISVSTRIPVCTK